MTGRQACRGFREARNHVKEEAQRIPKRRNIARQMTERRTHFGCVRESERNKGNDRQRMRLAKAAVVKDEEGGYTTCDRQEDEGLAGGGAVTYLPIFHECGGSGSDGQKTNQCVKAAKRSQADHGWSSLSSSAPPNGILRGQQLILSGVADGCE